MANLMNEADFLKMYPTPVVSGTRGLSDQTLVYRFTNEAAPIAPGTNVSYWQTVPNQTYASENLYVTTIGRLRRLGNVRLDALELNQGGSLGRSVVVRHPEGEVPAGLVRKVMPLKGYTYGTAAPVYRSGALKNHMLTHPVDVAWRELEGTMRFPSEEPHVGGIVSGGSGLGSRSGLLARAGGVLRSFAGVVSVILTPLSLFADAKEAKDPEKVRAYADQVERGEIVLELYWASPLFEPIRKELEKRWLGIEDA